MCGFESLANFGSARKALAGDFLRRAPDSERRVRRCVWAGGHETRAPHTPVCGCVYGCAPISAVPRRVSTAALGGASREWT